MCPSVLLRAAVLACCCGLSAYAQAQQVKTKNLELRYPDPSVTTEQVSVSIGELLGPGTFVFGLGRCTAAPPGGTITAVPCTGATGEYTGYCTLSTPLARFWPGCEAATTESVYVAAGDTLVVTLTTIAEPVRQPAQAAPHSVPMTPGALALLSAGLAGLSAWRLRRARRT